ncbi:hypothetical protein EVAR_37950_1 [Eumeta japonica]|uniref:Uncharacterized protein n=1 Tax=Eumeta variegata TaxID=151549 RepID=A0A4C1XDB5_EUMVA|nr:hypothetical protein EVAR_37950_1 [Eumeta japonica]
MHLFLVFPLRGEKDKKPHELPRIYVRDVCSILTNQKTAQKLDIVFRCQPRGCHQPYRTRPIDIEMPLACDSLTEGPLRSLRHRESREFSTRVGTSD